MPPENSVELVVEKCLEELGLTHLSELDVLTFLKRHGTSLGNAERISRLLGYSKAAIADALNKLESGGLVQRSRPSNGARYYELAPDVGSRKRCFQHLMDLAQKRSARLILAKKLRKQPDNGTKDRTSRPPPDRMDAKDD